MMKIQNEIIIILNEMMLYNSKKVMKIILKMFMMGLMNFDFYIMKKYF